MAYQTTILKHAAATVYVYQLTAADAPRASAGQIARPRTPSRASSLHPMIRMSAAAMAYAPASMSVHAIRNGQDRIVLQTTTPGTAVARRGMPPVVALYGEHVRLRIFACAMVFTAVLTANSKPRRRWMRRANTGLVARKSRQSIPWPVLAMGSVLNGVCVTVTQSLPVPVAGAW